MRTLVEQLRTTNRFGTAKSYEKTISSFGEFLGDVRLPLSALTEQVIADYNAFLVQRGLVRNSISFYMRVLRAVYNKAVRQKLIEQQHPFSEFYTDIDRFIEAQEIPYFSGYKQALEEVKNGRKINHWIWYIFPQLRGLGRSSRAQFYGIADRDEAQRYLEHPVLGARIREITEALLEHKDKTALSIFGHIDAIKVRSCMTMFDCIAPNDIFDQVLRSFYDERRCGRTLKLMQQE